ncbi:MAG: divalent-cation tolerance protein CutA [Candidatus Saccharibacteria bacterium]|nr:divalent-cation tolerance protein CutA [Candidatus Saccharibacteria bacterium]
MKYNFVELILTCEDQEEAQKIADSLLTQKLVACVEFIEIKSRFRWKEQIENGDEIKLIMTTIADNYDKIEAEVKKLHSYETFVLQQIPITRLNNEAAEWLMEITSPRD